MPKVEQSRYHRVRAFTSGRRGAVTFGACWNLGDYSTSQSSATRISNRCGMGILLLRLLSKFCISLQSYVFRLSSKTPEVPGFGICLKSNVSRLDARLLLSHATSANSGRNGVSEPACSVLILIQKNAVVYLVKCAEGAINVVRVPIVLICCCQELVRQESPGLAWHKFIPSASLPP